MKLLDQVSLEWLSSQLCGASRRYNIDARLESYSCKMVSEEKRQFRELVARLTDDEKHDTSYVKLGCSQTLRELQEMTGQTIDPGSYHMSHLQDQSSPVNPNASPSNNSVAGKKRHRSDTTSSSEDVIASPPPTHKSSALLVSAKDLFCLMSTLNSCFGPTYDFLSARSDEFCLEPELRLVKHFISRFCSIYVDKYESVAPQLWKTIEEEIVPSQCRIYSYRPDHLSDPYSSGCLSSFNYFFHNRLLKRILFFSLRVLNDPLVTNDYEENTQDLY